MPRPRKPTNILKFAGAFDKNPKRGEARQDEVKPTGEIGTPPDYFTAVQDALWYELIGESLPGVLSNSDRKILELTVLAIKKNRDDYDPKLATQINLFLQQLGMTPASRSKVSAKPNADKDKDASLSAI